MAISLCERAMAAVGISAIGFIVVQVLAASHAKRKAALHVEGEVVNPA